MTPEQLDRVEELKLLDKITLSVRLMKAEEQLQQCGPNDEQWNAAIQKAMLVCAELYTDSLAKARRSGSAGREEAMEVAHIEHMALKAAQEEIQKLYRLPATKTLQEKS